MPETGTARCHCGGVCGTRVAFEPVHDNRKDEVHLTLALFLTPVDKAPSLNSFARERPEWSPFHDFANAG